MTLSEPTRTTPTTVLPPLRVEYVYAEVADVLPQNDVLAVVAFGQTPGQHDDPRYLRVGLDSPAPAPLEVWRVGSNVRCGQHGLLKWSCTRDYLFFSIELDEQAFGGITRTAEHAYLEIGQWLASNPLGNTEPVHVLRLWNYLDAINVGEGDNERYRLFCAGRARGIGSIAKTGYTAATAIGRRDGRRVLQVYGLAARAAGTAIENPRQVSAWTYPREYGPVAPTFARATRTGANQLLISGTAAVVGHQSRHVGDTLAQLDETLSNLSSLFSAAGPQLSTCSLADTLLKIYLRNPAEFGAVQERLRETNPGLPPPLILFGDICRSDLRIEIDGILG